MIIFVIGISAAYSSVIGLGHGALIGAPAVIGVPAVRVVPAVSASASAGLGGAVATANVGGHSVAAVAPTLGLGVGHVGLGWGLGGLGHLG